MDLLVNLRWCVAELRKTGHFEVASSLLGGDPAGFRRELRAAAKAAGMRVHTRLSDRGMSAWDPDHVVSVDRVPAGIDALGRRHG